MKQTCYSSTNLKQEKSVNLISTNIKHLYFLSHKQNAWKNKRERNRKRTANYMAKPPKKKCCFENLYFDNKQER